MSGNAPTPIDLGKLAKICPEMEKFAGFINPSRKRDVMSIGYDDTLTIARRFIDMAEDVEFLAIRAYKHGETSKSRTCELLHIDLMVIRKILKNIHKLSGWEVDDFTAELARLRKE